MRKIIFFVFLCFLINAYAVPFKQLVFFGDSLSDDGNLYKLLLKIIPKSPPYYKGRFSNGPTWAENISDYYYSNYYMDAKNYAVGGATAIFHLPNDRFFAPTNLQLEVDKYLLDTSFEDRENILFNIWIGGNDYLFDQKVDVEKATEAVTTGIIANIERLISHGGRRFLIFNLPDLSKTPFANTEDKLQLKRLTVMHNLKLTEKVKMLVEKYTKVKLVYVNFYDIFNDVMSNPEKYNRKYKVNIKNISEGCWKGGFMLQKSISREQIASDVRQALNEAGKEADNLDIQAITTFIASNPAMLTSYQIGNRYSGEIPCPNPDEYLFWDKMHPTAIAHKVIGNIMVDFITAQFPG